MKKKILSIIGATVIIAVMVVNLRVDHINLNFSNLALANIQFLTANAEGTATCSTTCPDTLVITVTCANCTSFAGKSVNCYDENYNLIEEITCMIA